MNGTNILSGAHVDLNPDAGCMRSRLQTSMATARPTFSDFNPGAASQAHGTGDYNGDGKADIEWQNTDDTPAVWLMDGTNVVSGGNGTDPGANWHVIPHHHDLV